MPSPAWLTPDKPPTTFTVCRRLVVPFEFYHVVTGALDMLANTWNWESHGTYTPAEAAALFEDILWQFRENAEMATIGTFVQYATADPPYGVLPCDGASYQRLDYPSLYAVLDAVYILDADTFQVPDMRGRFALASGAGVNPGDTGGAETHTLTVNEIPAHDHLYLAPQINPDVEGPGIPDIGATVLGPQVPTTMTGGGQSHNNMPPYLGMAWGIVAIEPGCLGIGGELAENAVTFDTGDYVTTVSGDPYFFVSTE